MAHRVDSAFGPFFKSYKRDEMERFLQDVAYRGFKVNTIATELEGARSLSYNQYVLKIVTKTGETISANLAKAYFNENRWTFSYLIHRIRMCFPETAYAKEFNQRIRRLAECILQTRFAYRAQENLGTLAALPQDVRQHILSCMPIDSEETGGKFLRLMAWLCKAALGEPVILKSISPKQLAEVINRARIFFPYLRLNSEFFSITKPHLTRLWLEQNRPLLSSQLAHCIALRELYITSHPQHRNDIHSDYDGSDYYTGAIDNQIGDKHLQEIIKLTGLITLKIFNNRIRGEGFIHLTTLTRLTSLQIAHAPLKTENLKYITPLTSLTFLDLSSCHDLVGDDFKHLTSLQNLKILHLICCDIGTNEADIMKHIRQLENLTELNVSQNCVLTGKGLRQLAGHPRLSYLNLFKCFILQPKNWQHIAEIPHLTYLNLTLTCPPHHNLSDEVCAQLGKLQHLTTLSLDDRTENHITSVGLKPLKALKHLWLYQNSYRDLRKIQSEFKEDAWYQYKCDLVDVVEKAEQIIKAIISLNNGLVDLKQQDPRLVRKRAEILDRLKKERNEITAALYLMGEGRIFLDRYRFVFDADVYEEANTHKQQVMEAINNLRALVQFSQKGDLSQIKNEMLSSIKYFGAIAEDLITLIDFLPKKYKIHSKSSEDLPSATRNLLYDYFQDTYRLIDLLKSWIKILSFIPEEPDKKIYLHHSHP